MSDQQTQYDIFPSYARKDNAPIPDGAPLGWVTALRDHILEDHRRFTTEPLRIFFDQTEMQMTDDWRHRILGALQSSRILLVCLSPNYFASKPCRWEWEEYRAMQVHHLIGADTIAAIYFVEVPGTNELQNAKWLHEVTRPNYADIRPWYPQGAAALAIEDVQKRIAALSSSLWERIQRSRHAQNVSGNLRRVTPFFVGRAEELRRLHEKVGIGAIGVVTAMHGLGGQGKTELAVAYAHGWADFYRAGLWSLNAEGKSSLLDLIGELALTPEFGYKATDEEKSSPELLGRVVLEELKRRAAELHVKAPHRSAASLIVLDNVSEPALLSARELAKLPEGDWLRVIATTRLGPDKITRNEKRLALLPVDSLDDADAFRLLERHQPPRNHKGTIDYDSADAVHRFATAADESGAREIVGALGGFTLAIEQVAIFLGIHPEIAPGSCLAGLVANGLPSADSITADATAAEQMLHQEKQLAPILAATLSRLDDASRTALQLAALLPPDTVPWPWLQAATAARHPEAIAHGPHQADPWQVSRRRLTGLRLLTQGDDPEIARIHRLVAAHILKDPTTATLRRPLASLVERRGWSVYKSQSAPAPWELEALTMALPHLLAFSEGAANQLGNYIELANATVFVSDKVATYRGIPGAKSLLESAQSYIRRLAASDPGNAQWQRDLSVSHNRLGDLAVAQGDLSGAYQRFTDGLIIAERLAASDPGNAQWQRDLSVSHNRLGDLAVAQGDLSGAYQRFTDGLIIAERLAASDPGNAEWQRDLWVSYSKLATVAEKSGDPGAREYWQKTYDTMMGMKRRGMHVSPQDERVLQQVAAKLAQGAAVQGGVGRWQVLQWFKKLWSRRPKPPSGD